ncbi:MAG: riboflavin biosynthesis protein RibF [Dictyoglomi bacterium]|nr:riboflavin biosynthesis protein RibF [Dictyoglomota bacterium]
MVIRYSLPTYKVKGVVIGSFDGLHRGHVALLGLARKFGVDSVLTFYPVPKAVKEGVGHITVLWEKVAGFSGMGFDNIFVLNFKDERIRNMEAEEFLRKLEPYVDIIVVGFNFRFGRDRQGDIEMLKEWGKLHDKKIIVMEPEMEGDIVISSSNIRQSIEEGKLEEARIMLGYPYFASGPVIRERGIGTKMGFPTINIQVPSDKIMPPYGVYSGLLATDDGKVVWAVANWGEAPTFGRKEPRLEVHVLDEVMGELHPEKALFVFQHFIREERKFDSVDELKHQIDMDLKKAISLYDPEFIHGFYRAFLPYTIWRSMSVIPFGYGR